MTPALEPLGRQVVVITGASSGIGLATARMAVNRGARVVLAARSHAALAQLVDEITRAGGRAVAVDADVSDEAQVQRVAETAVQTFGGFHTWINNAAVSANGGCLDVTVSDMRRIMDTNFWGVVYGSRIACRHLMKTGGALINVGSVLSDRAAPLQGIYSASKHAIKGWTDALRAELLHAGASVSVTLVKPSAIGTPYAEHAKNYLEDRSILCDEQSSLPRVFLEHDPPRGSPTDTQHPFDDPDGLLVHVTAFNDLMWDNGRTPTRVVEHGVIVPADVRYTGEIERGLVVVNGLPKRGRRLGADVFEAVRRKVPLDLVGIGSEAVGGLGEIGHADLPGLMARYRFFFNPIRYTSLGLAVCEAMTVGMPIVALATTEMATVVENGVSGYVDTNVDALVERMRDLLENPSDAARLGKGARRTAESRFAIERFARDWSAVLEEVVRGTQAGATQSHAARRLSAHA